MFDDDTLALMVRDTESEISRDALDIDDPAQGVGGLVEEMSQTEGWNGEPLGDAEQIERTRYGNAGNGFDRPLELADEHAEIRESEQLRQQLAERDQQIQQLLDQTGPVRDAQERMQQQRREQLMEVAVDPAKADQVLSGIETMQQQIHAANMARVDASLEYAHRKYGKDFEDTYRRIQAMDMRNPMTSQIVQGIFHSDDPGQYLMHLHNNSLLDMLSSGREPPPFMPRPSRPPPGRDAFEPSAWDEEANAGVYPDQETEIFKAATR